MSATLKPFVMSPQARAAVLAASVVGLDSTPTQPVRRVGVGYDRPLHNRLKAKRKRDRQNRKRGR